MIAEEQNEEEEVDLLGT